MMSDKKLKSLQNTATHSLKEGTISEDSFKKAWTVFHIEAHNKLPSHLAQEFDKSDFSGIMWTVEQFIEELKKMDPKAWMQFASFDRKLDTCLAFVESGVNDDGESICFVIGSSVSTPNIIDMFDECFEESLDETPSYKT